MLRAQNITNSFGGQLLLEDVSFLMNKGERLGLVGRNGSGKTTLFRMILGEEEPDSGKLITPRGYTTGHLSQHLVFHHKSILEEACSALPSSEDGIDLTYKAEAALMGLGFDKADFDRAPSEFSGGYQIRVNLAKVLISEPNLLLLDEPTNYLDIVSVRWLRNYLRAWPGELVIISHDRKFLSEVTTHTMLIHRQGLRRMAGTVEKVIEQIAVEEEVHEKTRVNEEKKRKQDEKFIERFRYKASKAKAVQSRIKALARRGEIEELADERSLEFRFRHEPFHAPVALKAKGLEFAYPGGPTLVDDLSLEVAKGDRIAVIGKNGKGKTTLLNLLADELEPNRGEVTLHPAVRPAYFGQTNIDRLDPRQTIEDEILSVHPEHNRSAARGVGGLRMFEGDLAMTKVSVLSGGDRSRVLIGKILVSPSNLMLLDEPTNHLDMESVEYLLEAIEYFPGAVIKVTH
ncbi:MAG: ABC-F family ATP-binding cassette domain-containing protein, partial [Planctomycetota bacterium]